jgi:UDP-galactopyranose mutase
MAGFEYIIVGSGITGSTIARMLADAGKRPLIVERRAHRGGNVHDSVHECGVRVHTYGPHYFRCNSDKIWDFVRRFSDFYPYEARVKTHVNGRLENWPVDAEIIRRFAPPGWRPPRDEGDSFEEACLARMPREVYARFIEGYTKKQWGCSPRTLDKRLARRIRLNPTNETRLTPSHRYQGLPTAGYATFMAKMTEGIETWLDFDFQKRADSIRKSPNARIIYTGPIDEFFDYRFGRLAYRGQKRTHQFIADRPLVQPCAQINYPNDEHGAIRTIEWKHLMPESDKLLRNGTVITSETPFSATIPNDCEYPFPDEINRRLYEKYRAHSADQRNVIFCGRLAEYRYLDMDQALGRAMMVAERLLCGDPMDFTMQNEVEPTSEIAFAKLGGSCC